MKRHDVFPRSTERWQGIPLPLKYCGEVVIRGLLSERRGGNSYQRQ
ncbi:MAG: hypothetical protein ACAI35_00205 [Candidatus Methylacidiphilales bacterium]|nr:hypothetical protein [Candidatus Methylacidiphilales bacterium]